MARIKRVAVIGAGPAGTIAVDALAQEEAFDVIRIFERREKVGGCWVQDPAHVSPQLPDFKSLAERSADKPHDIPPSLPTYTPRSMQYRHDETSVYPLLETNVVTQTMEFSQEPIPLKQTALSIKRHGPDTPFRHHTVIQQYIEGLLDRKGYKDFLECGVTVERVEKVNGSWKVTLRKAGAERDYWWAEEFDAVVVASGHYTVPYVPYIEGLEEFARTYPGSVEHSKGYRGSEKYRNKNVVVVGASVSGMDIARDLLNVAQHPVNAVVRGKWHPYFGKSAFDHADIKKRPAIKKIESEQGRKTVIFEDGSHIDDVDNIILGTGYSWTLPFLPNYPVRNNRVPGLYLHVFQRQDPTLVFIGAVAAGFTFKVFEWQAVLAARFFAGRIQLPSITEQEKWETDRITYKGDGVPFTALYPDFEDYFKTVKKLAGEPAPGKPGRRLPEFGAGWREIFENGHKRRIKAWEEANEARSRAGNSIGVRARL